MTTWPFHRLSTNPVRWRWLVSVVVPLIAVSATPAVAEDLKAQIAAVCTTQKVPGIIAASIGPDGVIESAAAGVRKRGAKDAISTDDQFSLGSNSKSFTATLAGVLVDDQAIEWSTTISQVWPDLPIHAGFQEVTLEQLLVHTGGLQGDLPPTSSEWSSFFAEKNTPEKERARMRALLLTKPPEGTVGQHAYSNLGYVMAAAMLEERGKQPFEQLMQDRVFKPLGMTKTEFYSSNKLKSTKTPLLWGHTLKKGDPIKPGELGSENPTVYAGCGTIRTTIVDWAKYLRWHVKESAAPVLKSDETLRHLHTGVNRGVPGQTYGFGWIQFDSPFGRTLQHAGNNTNQFSLVWVMPDKQRATVVITNTGQEQAFPACDAVTALLMKSPAFR